jgi:lysophospholipid acyltransferase (LPLAT)-like uncharacterized protein
VKRLRRILTPLAPPLAALVIRALGATLQWTIRDEAGLIRNPSQRSYLYAFWHNRILMMPWLHERHLASRTLTVMISQSRDGQMITRVAQAFGVQAARGSSSKKGIQAFLQLAHGLKKGNSDVAVTPDGPRGPRYAVHPGILYLSHLSQLPILPVTIQYAEKWEAGSWDRFQIPKPFTRATLQIHAPLPAPPDASEETFEALGRVLASRLGE